MLTCQFVRIVAFFLLALLLAGAANFVCSDRQPAIVVFGIFVVALSVLMPALYFEIISP